MKIGKKYFLFIILIICFFILSVGCGKSANTSSKNNKSTKNKITESSNSNNTSSEPNNSVSTSPADNNTVASPNNNTTSSTEVPTANGNSNQSNTSAVSKNSTIQQSSQATKYIVQQPQSSAKAASIPTPSAATPPTAPSIQTFTGFITSEDDFAASLKEDTAFMIYMRLMALSGLGITFQQNGQWVFYYFDGNITTDSTKGPDGKWVFNGTGSQLNAWNIVESQVKENNGTNKMNPVAVTVTGTLNGNTQTNPGPDADGKHFSVITVKSITKN